jgi:hypothetical protein
MEETAKLALLFGFLWFAANWALNASLEYTNVANVSILSAMSGKRCVLGPVSLLLTLEFLCRFLCLGTVPVVSG